LADLVVRPSYQFTETDIVTVDKLNLAATPVVDLALETPVNDQNYFRNGNFYSSFWKTPAGLSCPVGVETENADYWLVNPNGAAVTSLRSTNVPDLYSLFSLQITGAVNVTDCSVGQQISADLSAVLRRKCTVSGIIENNSGANVSPLFEIWTADSFNNFSTVTLQDTVNLQTCPTAAWTPVQATVDLTNLANVANGLFLKFRLPSGALSAGTKTINFSRLKFQIGEIATEFVDDASLFIQTPSVDSTMLQDGCIARPSLFMPAVVPKGAYVAKSIEEPDIDDGAISARCLASTAISGSLGYTPVNRAGDAAMTGSFVDTLDTVVGSGAPGASGFQVLSTSANAANDGYFPAISFQRPGTIGRSIGLETTGRFKTVDSAGTVGYLLDSVTGVDTASYQDGSITLAKLAQSLINILIPPGIVRMFSGVNIPTGWLICDGSEVSRTTYAALFSAIGTYWGPGDAVNTFNLPDFRGRSPLGYVNSAIAGITSRAFASKGGEENHVLSVAELAYHNHTLHDGTHSHTTQQSPHHHNYINPTGATGAQPGSGQYSASGATNTGDSTISISIDAAGANISIDPAGSNGAHNTLHPFAVLYFLIKT
jgi:microcystin-dependent protein